MVVNGGGVGPSLGGFQSFVSGVMGVPIGALDPTTAPVVGYAYDFALNWVSCQLEFIPGQPGANTLYAQAVYNLAADTLINWAQDQSGAPVYKNDMSYWQYLRSQYGVLNFVAGVVNSTSDEGTSASYMVPKTFEGYTIANLQNLKTPYGRNYLGIVSSLGTLWGAS